MLSVYLLMVEVLMLSVYLLMVEVEEVYLPRFLYQQQGL